VSEPFALYVHVPWCRRVCPYCDFNVYASASPPEAEYTRALVAELAAAAGDDAWRGRSVGTVYLGGGTPSLFSPAAIDDLVDAVARHFALAAAAEITLEANPGTVPVDRLAGYRAAGVNRLSLGAQSFHPRHLATLGRDHDAEDTRAAVAAARAAGLDNVSLDLVFAVPGQTLAEWEADVRAAVALEPAHVSAYGLTYEEGTPFHARRARGRLVPVAEDDEAAMADATVAALEHAGYARYEISSFARPGFASRHNTSYWDGSDYLGLGAGAHSFSRRPAPGWRWSNERTPARYLAAVRTACAARATEEHLTEAQARGEFCFSGLRMTAGLDGEAFRRRFGVALDTAFPHLRGLVAEGLVERIGARVRLTSEGFRHADTVSATFV
jgi:oxygen-independent coproporphyrinogen-3 oxidase